MDVFVIWGRWGNNRSEELRQEQGCLVPSLEVLQDEAGQEVKKKHQAMEKDVMGKIRARQAELEHYYQQIQEEEEDEEKRVQEEEDDEEDEEEEEGEEGAAA